jgi:hypothetical protein
MQRRLVGQLVRPSRTRGRGRKPRKQAVVSGHTEVQGGSSCQELCKSHPGGKFKSGGSYLR